MALSLNSLIEHAISQDASDIHIAPDTHPIIRVHGDIKFISSEAFSKNEAWSIVQSITPEHLKESLHTEKELDFAFSFNDKIRFRVNIFQTINGFAAAMRFIPIALKSLKELYAPSVISGLTSLDKGLILVTGPTGSGKSTTLAAMIHEINNTKQKHIVTIEDPVEFIHKSNKCLINQRQIGDTTNSFADALRSALREDPDVILIGELRDLDSIRLAITAAETGHLVLGTLHTNSASQTINRIIDVFPGDDKDLVRTMLSTSLEAVISQRLLPRMDNKGRVAAYEIMLATKAIKNLIREGKIPQIHSLMQVGGKEGMIIMADYVQNLIDKNMVHESSSMQVVRSAEEVVKSQHINKPNLDKEEDSEF